MGDIRERNRIHSRVDEMPPELRQLLDDMLADTRYSYQDITDEINAQGFEISRSSVGRYAMRHNSAAKRLKAAKEQTDALISFIRENQGMESTELATAILTDGLTRRLATADEEFDNMPVEKAGQLLVQLQRTTVYKERYKKERGAVISAVEANIKQRMRELIRDDPPLLARLQQLVSDAAEEEANKADD